MLTANASRHDPTGPGNHGRGMHPADAFFAAASQRAKEFAGNIIANRDDIVRVLTEYETHEVANDEINRSLDLLLNLDVNRRYFVRKIRRAVAFLPLNQPLYSLCCFGVIPALMAEEVFVRAPAAMEGFFDGLAARVQLSRLVANLTVSSQSREEFVRTHAATYQDDATGEARPLTDVIIFTGSMMNADKVRKKFHSRTLFIANGSGHNPVVVGEHADLERTVHCYLRVRLYNQGQDCAAPNTILVRQNLMVPFLALLKAELRKVNCGAYADPSVRVGPLSRRADLSRVQQSLLEEAEWLDEEFEGVVRTRSGLVEPALIVKPLRLGGNYTECFAPILFVQEYDKDEGLADYFEHEKYKHNAMYITLFGESDYVNRLANGMFGLHDSTTVIRDADLHAPGIERGVNPYGGFGRGASCLSIHGQVICKPTLPQRDIFEHVVRESPLLGKEPDLSRAKRPRKVEPPGSRSAASPVQAIVTELDPIQKIATAPLNASFISTMSEEQRAMVRDLRELLATFYHHQDALNDLVHQVVQGHCRSKSELNSTQREFFATLYNLLLARDHGPRISTLLRSADPAQVLRLLDV